MFGDSTFLLGVMSLIVCVLLTVYLFFLAYRPNIVQVVGAALVVVGGLGNAFDRFALGYVCGLHRAGVHRLPRVQRG